MPKKPPSTTRRFYDAAYKLQAVRKVREQQLTVRAVCQDLPLSESILRCWLATYNAEQSGTAPGTGRPSARSNSAFVNEKKKIIH